MVRLPNETWDLVVAPPGGKAPFVTSNQCQGCHSAAIAPFGPTMYLPSKGSNGINVSPYTEWRWSPMGLAGRDPIFFAQLESELAYLDDVRDAKTRATLKQTVVDTCFRCHGVMGKRQHDLDVPGGHFSLGVHPAHRQRAGRQVRRAGARRHQLRGVPPHRARHAAAGLEEEPARILPRPTRSPGSSQTGPPDQIFGPFKDDEIVTVPMNNALGAKPVFNPYIKSARMCGSCHTIKLPVLDKPPVAPVGPTTAHSIEQATYLEWLNSEYQNEFGPPNPKAQDLPGLSYARRLHEPVARHRRPADPDAHRDRRGRHLSGRGAPRARRPTFASASARRGSSGTSCSA